MQIDQGDLLWGMDMLFVKQFMAITTEEHHAKGHFIIREGDRADYFYTLIKGCVRVTIGGAGQEVYSISHAGEAFGWSSLLDRNYYSASAECLEPTDVRKLRRGDLERLLHENPQSGLVFYKRIAGMLGNRLIQCYQQLYPQPR
jgi:CRP-like cAMP-binding protein